MNFSFDLILSAAVAKQPSNFPFCSFRKWMDQNDKNINAFLKNLFHRFVKINDATANEWSACKIIIGVISQARKSAMYEDV